MELSSSHGAYPGLTPDRPHFRLPRADPTCGVAAGSIGPSAAFMAGQRGGVRRVPKRGSRRLAAGQVPQGNFLGGLWQQRGVLRPGGLPHIGVVPNPEVG